MFGDKLKNTITVFLLFAGVFCYGQSSQEQFGKNRIQYQTFKWTYIATLNFDVYYYDGGRELALNAAKHAEADFERISELIGFSPYTKIKLIVYNSVADLHQSNIGLEESGVFVGGNTNFVKSKIEIAFKGSQPEFNKEITNGISSIILNLLMYGGSLKEVVQSSYLLSLPPWFLQGAEAYISEGWSNEMDNFIRDVAIRNRFKNPASLQGEEARLTGQSIWNFVAQVYGKENLSSILNLARIIRNEQESIESTLGMTYHEFLKHWREYYSRMADELKGDYENPSPTTQLQKNNSQDAKFNNIIINEDGNFLAYSKYKHGIYKVVIHDLQKRKSRTLLRGGSKLVDQRDFKSQPLLAWQKDMRLSVIAVKKNKVVYNSYKTEKKFLIKRALDALFTDQDRRVLAQFDQVMSYDIAEDGKTMLISGDIKGQSDLFLYDLRRNTMTQLTNDIYDDLDPTFTTGNSFAFSSNRLSDSTKMNIPSKENKFDNYQIYILDRDISKGQIKKLTDEGNNFKPIFYDNSLFFLSDRKGVNNLYRYSFESKSSTQLTAFVKNIETYSINPKNQSVAYSMLDKGKRHIYYQSGFDFLQEKNTVQTARVKAEIKTPIKQRVNFSSKDTVTNAVKEIDLNEFLFESDRKKSDEKVAKETIKQSPPEVAQNPKKDLFKFVGPYAYKNLFGINKLTSTLQVDPLKGTGIFMDVAMGDMHGNHKMSGGIFEVLDLKSNNIFGEYQYLKRRVDLKVRYDRERFYQNLQDFGKNNIYTLNRLAITGSYPLSVSSRISLGGSAIITRASSENPTILDQVDVYEGLKGEYVFDNTATTGMNMLEGTRIKIAVENNRNTTSRNLDFGKFTFDLRHYQPIHKEIVFASRVSYGSFFGNSPKNFLMGGMDNWLFNKTDHAHSADPLTGSPDKYNTDLLFVKYITNIRGFDYNTLYGQKYLLINLELRVPIVKYFYKGPITSNFFRNLQIIGFTDGGTAWSGRNPFSHQNSINTQIISSGGSPFTATVVNYINPFLVGYGVGARTMFLGYYMKADVAWGLLNRQVQKPKLYLTFGYDF